MRVVGRVAKALAAVSSTLHYDNSALQGCVDCDDPLRISMRHVLYVREKPTCWNIRSLTSLSGSSRHLSPGDYR